MEQNCQIRIQMDKCWKLLKSLQSSKDILILSADKGNATVVVSVLRGWIACWMTGCTYGRLKGVPTTPREAKIRKNWFDVERRGEISDKMRTIHTQHAKPQLINGLPSIHKEEVPLRPIVSAIDSPTYKAFTQTMSHHHPRVFSWTIFAWRLGQIMSVMMRTEFSY